MEFNGVGNEPTGNCNFSWYLLHQHTRQHLKIEPINLPPSLIKKKVRHQRPRGPIPGGRAQETQEQLDSSIRMYMKELEEDLPVPKSLTPTKD